MLMLQKNYQIRVCDIRWYVMLLRYNLHNHKVIKCFTSNIIISFSDAKKNRYVNKTLNCDMMV